jgi:hypothetical protein
MINILHVSADFENFWKIFSELHVDLVDVESHYNEHHSVLTQLVGSLVQHRLSVLKIKQTNKQ